MLLNHWNKVQLIGVIAAARGLTRYLEITTTTTGGTYDQAVVLDFRPCMRLVYRAAVHPLRDGLPIDFTSDDDDTAEPIAKIRSSNLVFDMIFLDAHHTYECAIRDPHDAYSLLAPGGAILVHDCNPPDQEIASPVHQDGAWCGVTYKSFIDFTLGNPSFDSFTIDADYGCGVILKPRSPLDVVRNQLRAFRQRGLKERWSEAAKDFDTAYKMFDSHRQDLLRLGGFGLLKYKLSR